MLPSRLLTFVSESMLQELRTLSHHQYVIVPDCLVWFVSHVLSHSDLVTAATRSCLRKAVACSATVPSIEKLLVSLLFHCSKSGEHATALKDLEHSFQGNYHFPIIQS